MSEFVNGHMANAAAEFLGFLVGELEVLHEGLSSGDGDRATVAKDEGDGEDVVEGIGAFPVGLLELGTEVHVLLLLVGCGGWEV